MNCERYRAERLGVGTESPAAAEHRVACATCAGLHAEMDRIERTLAEPPAPPAGLTERVMAALPGPERRTVWFDYMKLAAAVAVAAAAAVALSAWLPRETRTPVQEITRPWQSSVLQVPPAWRSAFEQVKP